MAESLLTAIAGGSAGGGIVSTIQDVGNQIFAFLRRVFNIVWREMVRLYYRFIDLLMTDPVAFVTAMGELIVLLA